MSRLQTTVSWSTATCASVWSREYPTGLSVVALASGFSEESSSVTPVYPQLYHLLLSSSSRRSREDRATPYQFVLLSFISFKVSVCSRLCNKVGQSNSSRPPHISPYSAARTNLRVKGLFSRRPDPASAQQPASRLQAPPSGPRRPRYIAIDGVDAGPKPARPRRFPLPFSSPPLQFLAVDCNQSPRHAQIDAARARNMSGNSSIARGGPLRGRSSDDDEEAKKRRSDASRLRGSRQWTNYELRPPPKFNRWEARADQGCPSPDFPHRLRARPPCACPAR
jgi:hypothetical protein